VQRVHSSTNSPEPLWDNCSSIQAATAVRRRREFSAAYHSREANFFPQDEQRARVDVHVAYHEVHNGQRGPTSDVLLHHGVHDGQRGQTLDMLLHHDVHNTEIVGRSCEHSTDAKGWMCEGSPAPQEHRFARQTVAANARPPEPPKAWLAADGALLVVQLLERHF
jgi:hypothetical protein